MLRDLSSKAEITMREKEIFPQNTHKMLVLLPRQICILNP